MNAIVKQHTISKLKHGLAAVKSAPEAQRLQILAGAHFVVAAFTGGFSTLLLVAELAFAVQFSAIVGSDESNPFGLTSLFTSTQTAVAGVLLAIVLAASGVNLLRSRRVVAGVVLATAGGFLCPFGTALGLMTLYVLLSPVVREWRTTSGKAVVRST